MAVIQFSIPSNDYVVLVERAAALGISEHQLAKYLALLSTATDDEVLTYRQRAASTRADKRLRARPIG